ncbi:prolipoprotein diacylglyceryl transferase [Pseudopedobacter saltans DSM 12145]|uniref:Phosphatidylglycerol--prolipoprotein diacylglyceryl transferase n=1 Tax=Pseudopedobacter saltans (strain ATCC 51119 / DSM 12145 / JCM 21818 / CCUG 39354 / LMG 10337 / NBRC 100064 / NCIMB 13643) TaxID=762903 RepID=F0S4I9_PSESL|nr:prolipoprotein diacylglyceryl transferase [Pseudopedobacter saltans]ADY51980.1 prolipoprotein diacylglyceryl transferase [Pseudopedobacter saltans DSM 12145]
MLLDFITWNPSDSIVDLGFISIKYYSLCFLLAFVSSYIVVKKQFDKRNIGIEILDKLTIYVFLGTLIGARLGHCLFYDFAYYSKHPLEIILPFTFSPFKFTGFQGLASHGGGVGILVSLYLFSRNYKMNLWYLIDTVAMVVPLAGGFIRLGNLMNSEIIGKPTDVSWAFIFVKEDMLPRHPAQLYESICYFILFFVLYNLNKERKRYVGFNFGFVITGIFIVRFLVEFIKENQSAFEANMAINMGQILSIPFILVGLYFLLRKPKVAEK